MLDHCGEVHGQQLEAPAARQLVLPCFVRVELDNPIEERQRLVLGRGVHVRRDCVLGVEAAGQSVFAEGVARLRLVSVHTGEEGFHDRRRKRKAEDHLHVAPEPCTCRPARTRMPVRPSASGRRRRAATIPAPTPSAHRSPSPLPSLEPPRSPPRVAW